VLNPRRNQRRIFRWSKPPWHGWNLTFALHLLNVDAVRYGPYMYKKEEPGLTTSTCKFLAPEKLKHTLEQLAAERNIALSALLR